MKTILLAALLFAFSSPVTFAQDPEHPLAKAVAAKLKNPKKRFTVIVKATVKEGEAEKFIAAFAEAVEPTRKEDGCSRYDLNQIDGEANTFVIYERWGNLEKMKAHLAAPHTVKLLETVLPLMDGDAEIIVLTPKGEPVKPKTDAKRTGDPEAEIKGRVEAAAKEAEEAKKKAESEIRKALEEIQKEGKLDSGTK
jgi:quinol monooxygenase YgiN